jgi:hypothetical protein
VKPETLQSLVKGELGFSSFLNLIFLRVIKVVILCLVLTLIVYLLWQGKFTLGSFLAGAVVGLMAFLIRTRLKHPSIDRAKEESSPETDTLDGIAGSEEIHPKASVKE